MRKRILISIKYVIGIMLFFVVPYFFGILNIHFNSYYSPNLKYEFSDLWGQGMGLILCIIFSIVIILATIDWIKWIFTGEKN